MQYLAKKLDITVIRHAQYSYRYSLTSSQFSYRKLPKFKSIKLSNKMNQIPFHINLKADVCSFSRCFLPPVDQKIVDPGEKDMEMGQQHCHHDLLPLVSLFILQVQ
jgi:hypothetical protein